MDNLALENDDEEGSSETPELANSGSNSGSNPGSKPGSDAKSDSDSGPDPDSDSDSDSDPENHSERSVHEPVDDDEEVFVDIQLSENPVETAEDSPTNFAKTEDSPTNKDRDLTTNEDRDLPTMKGTISYTDSLSALATSEALPQRTIVYPSYNRTVSTISEKDSIVLYKRRWLVLMLFSLCTMMNEVNHFLLRPVRVPVKEPPSPQRRSSRRLGLAFFRL